MAGRARPRDGGASSSLCRWYAMTPKGSSGCGFDVRTRCASVSGGAMRCVVIGRHIYIGGAAQDVNESGSARGCRKPRGTCLGSPATLGNPRWCQHHLFRFLEVQASPSDLAPPDPQYHHPAFHQSRPVLLGPTPDPFAPLRLSKNGETEELGPEVRNALEELNQFFRTWPRPVKDRAGWAGWSLR